MALYDLSNPLDAENFKLRCNALYKKGCIVELTEKKPQRTTQQNRYLHAALGYFGALTGNTLDYVKRQYFKAHCNPELFIVTKDDPLLRTVRILRSSAELTTEEMTLAIERFRNWAAQEAEIYIPSPEEHRLVQMMEIEASRAKQYL
ncbi:MAG: hypothetical protein K2K08_03185 [Paramuribaculum sp.]|nr:hypothetical protein [Paramuribaculum sp.]